MQNPDVDTSWLLAALTAAARHLHTNSTHTMYLQIPVRGRTLHYGRFHATFPDPGCPVYQALAQTCWNISPAALSETSGGVWPPPRTHTGAIPGCPHPIHPAAVPELPAGRIRRSASGNRSDDPRSEEEFLIPSASEWASTARHLHQEDAVQVMRTYHVLALDAGNCIRESSRDILEAAVLLQTT